MPGAKNLKERLESKAMLETTYLRLSKAAEVLSADEDTLLIAATEGRIRLHWLLNRIVHAEKGYYEETAQPQPDEPPTWWVPEDFALAHFMYVPLSTMEAAELLKRESTTARGSMLSEQEGPQGSFWTPRTGWAEDGGGLTEGDLLVTRSAIFIKCSDVERIKVQGTLAPKESAKEEQAVHSRAHISGKLAKMNQAATKFWANADRHDRGTHPYNSTVARWLESQDFSPTLAEKAATIIRPEWVPTGRKPEE